MDRNDTLKLHLAELAKLLDAPDGIGGGAICLEAISAIEELESTQRRPPTEDAPA